MALDHLALSRSTLDRASHLRVDPELVRKLLADPSTGVLPVHAGKAPATDDGTRLVLEPAAAWGERWGSDWASGGGPVIFLGIDPDGRPYLAVPVFGELPLPEGQAWAGLRDVGPLLDDTGVGILTAAVAILAWHTAHPHCAKCGTASLVTHAGWTRHCPNCGTEHYPRTDPAVIMAIVDADDRILLGRQAAWPEHRFSTLAGFVEPGEPLEAAVRREVAEEAGVLVGDVEYRGSQPWPFPSSLMLGFRGRALSTEISVDGEELAQARWWSREELAADVRSGELLLPPAVSIARRLVEEWFGGPIDSDVAWG